MSFFHFEILGFCEVDHESCTLALEILIVRVDKTCHVATSWPWNVPIKDATSEAGFPSHQEFPMMSLWCCLPLCFFWSVASCEGNPHQCKSTNQISGQIIATWAPKWWFSKGHAFISEKSRLVKYYSIWPEICVISCSPDLPIDASDMQPREQVDFGVSSPSFAGFHIIHVLIHCFWYKLIYSII